MKSFCIKTNNSLICEFLLKNLDAMEFEDIYYINRQFKIYKNVIVHYVGKNINDFLVILSDLITNCIFVFYESKLIRKNLDFNYFYFDDYEKKQIEQICQSYIMLDEDLILKNRRNEIFASVLNYVVENKSMILDGFVNFRLPNYLLTIDEIVEYSVSKYVVEKEYNEFVNLLKLYIESKESQVDLVHLIYNNGESILLDKQKRIISLEDGILSSKYLSDISFSSNDYALNTLLTLLPQKIEIHIIGLEDEFINTLKLIFKSRVYICTGCNLCRTYNVLNNNSH